MVTNRLFSEDLDDLFEKAFGFNLKKPLRSGFPFCDIVQEDENTIRVDVAVAGYSAKDLEVYMEQNRIVIKGYKEFKDNEKVIYNGITRKNFVKYIPIASDLKIESTELQNGLLSFKLVRDSAKITKIDIKELSNGTTKSITSDSTSK